VCEFICPRVAAFCAAGFRGGRAEEEAPAQEDIWR
jgi:hypothetical protein